MEQRCGAWHSAHPSNCFAAAFAYPFLTYLLRSLGFGCCVLSRFMCCCVSMGKPSMGLSAKTGRRYILFIDDKI